MRSIIQQLLEFHMLYHCNCFQLENIFYTGKIMEILESVTKRIEEEEMFARLSSKFTQNIGQAKRILEANLKDPPLLKSLAGQVEMSLSHFKRTFKQLTGLTTHEFIRQKRMEFALTLLLNSSQTISQIADQVGYNSKSHFTKAFVDYFEIRPSCFRRSDQKR